VKKDLSEQTSIKVFAFYYLMVTFLRFGGLAYKEFFLKNVGDLPNFYIKLSYRILDSDISIYIITNINKNMTDYKGFEITGKYKCSTFIKFNLDGYVNYSNGSEKYIHCRDTYPFLE